MSTRADYLSPVCRLDPKINALSVDLSHLGGRGHTAALGRSCVVNDVDVGTDGAFASAKAITACAANSCVTGSGETR
jgi:hypothetical protein